MTRSDPDSSSQNGRSNTPAHGEKPGTPDRDHDEAKDQRDEDADESPDEEEPSQDDKDQVTRKKRRPIVLLNRHRRHCVS